MASTNQDTPSGNISSIFEAINRLDARQKLIGMVGVALLVAFVVGGYLWAKEPVYSVLFANLSERDGGEIVTTLQQQNVPYQISDNGNAILVPSSMVHDVRLRLASQGLPKGGLVGFELMENQKLGISQFAEQINYQRGLEGELARSIQSLGAVQGARVHLAIPKQTAFLRDEQKPTASVLVALRPGRVLEASQVAGIVHLVSSSVPELNPANVSVVDQDGNLISKQKDPMQEAGLDPGQLKYVREVETSYIKRIEAIVGTVVGASNVKAQVAADVDFSQSEQVAETYRPNPTPDTAIRSQQISETGSATPGAVGVPGALTNQPPAPASAQITVPPIAGGAPNATANAANQSNQTPQNFSKNSTVNFEVDKTVRHTKGTPGEVRRLSVAVVVNNKHDEKGGKSTPLTEAELKQITDLVREAMGFNKDRGDTLNVANANFTPGEKQEIPDQPLWKDPANIGLAKELLKYIAIAVLGYLLWNKLLKPMLDKLAEMSREQAARKAAMLAMANEADEDVYMQHAHQSFERKLANAKDAAKHDPKMVANVIKEWVGGNEPR